MNNLRLNDLSLPGVMLTTLPNEPVTALAVREQCTCVLGGLETVGKVNAEGAGKRSSAGRGKQSELAGLRAADLFVEHGRRRLAVGTGYVERAADGQRAVVEQVAGRGEVTPARTLKLPSLAARLSMGTNVEPAPLKLTLALLVATAAAPGMLSVRRP